ncbi:peptidylprolyl isomerase [Aquabacter sp. P-9]|uniref:peptidylprolyl isomerase n=1 Tax=Aquabacter sediminis TaxID=3029197 RepID=UPI00237E31CA|nr:SurA N-terminal domain-containing protein [Aquabacter sp. P-9]MDE1566694.1 SurA N-terminal domain-containing protein [Aquabacter sp. P-9]
MVLQTLRKGASGFIAKVFLAILTLSFVLWGVADVFRTYGANAVAKVGDTEISTDAFRQQYLNQLQRISRQAGRPITPEQARAFGLDRQILDQMIAETALDDQAKRLGLALSDDEIAREIRDNPAFRPQGATAFDPAYFGQLLRANGLTEERFIGLERQRKLREQLVESFGGNIAAPLVLRDLIHRYETQQRDVSYVAVGPGAAGPLPEPSEEQLKAFYDAHKITFRAPEYRTVAYLALTPATLAPWIQVSDADVKAAYDANPGRFGTPEKRTLQQIVFPSAQDAQTAAEKVKAGATFQEIAEGRKLSDQDISLGTVAKADLIDPKVAEAAFALPEGGTSAPVEGAFGSALVHVVKVVPSAQQPLEQVAPQLHQEIALDRARKELLDKHDAIEDERASGSTLAEVAQKVGLPLETVEGVDRSGRDPSGAEVTGIPSRADVVSGAFSAQPGVETDPVQLPQNGGYVWYEVKEITPARERPFDEVKDLVKARWTEDETVKAVNAKADALLAEVKGGKSLADVAAAAGLEVKTQAGLQRGRTTGDFPAAAVQAMFDAKLNVAGVTSGAVPAERILFQVTNETVPADTALDARLEAQLGQQLEGDVLNQYVAQLRKEVGVSINERSFLLAVGGSGN